MDNTEKRLAAQMLELASEEFGNHGCNDFPMDDTLLNRSFISAMNQWAGLEDFAPAQNGKIYTQDWLVMSYCAHLLNNETKAS
jgi:hypothetical protein